jgi:hypothetical protein
MFRTALRQSARVAASASARAAVVSSINPSFRQHTPSITSIVDSGAQCGCIELLEDALSKIRDGGAASEAEQPD